MARGAPASPLRLTRAVDESEDLPPLHLACAEELRRTPGADPAWQLVTTSAIRPSSASSGFEFVRPNRDDLDRQPRFEPNSLISS